MEGRFMEIDTANLLKKLTANIAFISLYLHLYRTDIVATTAVKTNNILIKTPLIRFGVNSLFILDKKYSSD
jgi:hypothetical protein